MRIRKRTAHTRVRARTLRRIAKTRLRRGQVPEEQRPKRVICNRKRTFYNRAAVISALIQIIAQPNCHAKRGYWCHIHGGWHLTKTDLRRQPVSSDVLPGDY